MRAVAVLGIGQTKIGEQWENSIREIAGEAVFSAMLDAGIDHADGIFMGNMMSGILAHQENLGTLLADWVGLRGIKAVKIEVACGSGAMVVRMGLLAVASGAMDCAIAIGVEKMTETKGTETTARLATAADADWEAAQGISFVGLNALPIFNTIAATATCKARLDFLQVENINLFLDNQIG